MQIIKYKWLPSGGGMEPFFFAKDGSEIKRIKLFDENLRLSLGKKKCIGYTRSGRHVNCPHGREVDEWHCNECRLNDDFFMCIKCTGEECINEKQRSGCKENMYFIYLAAFNSLLKVGISYEFRILERLIEQGADFAAKVACVRDGKEVRLVEQDVKSHLKIQDRVTGAQKQQMLFGDPNISVARITSAISSLQNNGVSKYMVPPEIYDLRDYYRLSKIHYAPSVLHVKENTSIAGECIAAKGNILVFSDSGRLFSLNSHDMIGRELLLN